MISRAMDYCLRACLFMAAHPEKSFYNVREMAQSLHVSQSYLGKILQKLVHKDFLKSITGPGGGFALARPTSEITLLDLLLAVDGMKAFDPCVLGLSSCDEAHPCPVHDTWKVCKGQMIRKFGSTSLLDASQSSWISRTTGWPFGLQEETPE